MDLALLLDNDNERRQYYERPPPDYVDYPSEYGPIRMRKSHIIVDPVISLPPPRPQQQRPRSRPASARPSQKRVAPPVPVPAPPPPPPPVDIPRSPSPQLPIVHLGTFVYPSTPFPLPPPTNPTPHQSFLTVLVPFTFLPRRPNSHPRIWGGGGSRRSRMYTDDSCLIQCAIHSGHLTPEMLARRRDIKILIKAHIPSALSGGSGGNGGAPEGARWISIAPELKDDEGYSASWGNSHDGGGIEILNVDCIDILAHSLHRPNRQARLLEYAQRRAALFSLPLNCPEDYPRKRKKIGMNDIDGVDSDKLSLLTTSEEKAMESLVVCLGFGIAKERIGFKYTPDGLKSIVFPDDCTEGAPKKRRKPNEDLGVELENAEEKYWLEYQPDSDSTSTFEARYTLILIKPNGDGKGEQHVLARDLGIRDVAFVDKGLVIWKNESDGREEREGFFCAVERWRWIPG